MESLKNFFSNSDFMPHIHCYLAKKELVWTMFSTDLIIGIAYVSISFSLYALVKKIRLPFSPMFIAFGTFIFACGLTHFMEVYTLWVPNYWLAAFIKIVTATSSFLTAFFLIKISPKILRFAEAAKESEQRGIDLASQTEMLIQTNSELLETQSRFRQFIEGVKDYAIFGLDVEGNIVIWNEGARRLTQYTSGEILNKNFSLLYTQEEIADNLPRKNLISATEREKVEIECEKVRKDGTKFWAKDLLTAIYDDKKRLTGYTVILRDKTDEKIAKEKLQAAFDELEQRVRDRTTELESALQNRDEFLSVASHELKTPLTSTYMQLQLLQRRFKKMAETQSPPTDADSEKLDMCLTQSIKLSQLIDELLDLTRIRGGRLKLNLEKVDLVEVVEEIVSSMEMQIQKNRVQLKIIKAENQSYNGDWDRLRIEQVVTNLVTNALKYGANEPIEIEFKKDSENIIFAIKDHGIGMSKDLQRRVFERFARGSYDNKISGLGLGLYITKQIVLAHKGFINLESEEGVGSLFEVHLPIHPVIDSQFKME